MKTHSENLKENLVAEYHCGFCYKNEYLVYYVIN